MSHLEGQSKQDGTKWNGTLQLRVGASGIDLLGENLNTVNKNTGFICQGKEFGIAVNAENAKYVLVTRTKCGTESNMKNGKGKVHPGTGHEGPEGE
jgi:hypothetical protein